MNINSIYSSPYTSSSGYGKTGVSPASVSTPEDKVDINSSLASTDINKIGSIKEASRRPHSSIGNILPSVPLGVEIPGAVGAMVSTLSDKVVVMVKDLGDGGDNFRNFRTSEDSFSSDIQNPPSRVGMENIKMSGSSEFTVEGLKQIKEKIPQGYQLAVVDLREESHGFLNGEPVTWKGDRNWANFGEDLTSIKQDETARLGLLAEQGNQTADEEQICKSLGVGYARIPVTDYAKPEYRDVDRFVDFVKGQPSGTWLHFHCMAGIGRTTAFMAMYDMMKNADNVSFKDILKRQELIGGMNLFQDTGDKDWKYQITKDRREFLYDFYQYCKENKSQNFPQSYTDWMESRYK